MALARSQFLWRKQGNPPHDGFHCRRGCAAQGKSTLVFEPLDAHAPDVSDVQIIGELLMLILFKRQKKYSPLPLPPGPPAFPLVGNLLDVPTNGAPGFHDLCTKYGMSIPGFPCIVWISSRPFIPGDIVYLNVAGKPMIILGSQEVALDILDKRSSNYSDRAASVMVDM